MAERVATGPVTGEPPAHEDLTCAAPSIVVRGGATPEQLAALVAVLSAVSGGEEPASAQPSSGWAAHPVALRHRVNHGPGAWRTSLRP